MREIELTQNKYTTVDNEHYDWLSQYSWHIKQAKNRSDYAKFTTPRKDGKQKTIHMHQILLWCPQGYEIDHINGNGLDNRMENLRIVTRLQNSMNQHKKKIGKSKYKGITYDTRSNSWQARIGKNNQRFNIGTFKKEEDAAQAYDNKAKELFGEFACLNFNY